MQVFFSVCTALNLRVLNMANSVAAQNDGARPSLTRGTYKVVFGQNLVSYYRTMYMGLQFAVILAQCFGITALTLVCVWIIKFSGGIGWDGGEKQFNIHPVTMVIGLVFLYGEGLLVYRTFRAHSKRYVKVIHAGLLFGALVSATVGISAVFQLHNKNGIPNLQTVHSWLGLTTYILFALQFVAGFVCFLLPSPQIFKKIFLPFHQFCGGAILLLVAATCGSGIMEKLADEYGHEASETLGKLPKTVAMGNAAALMIVAFAITVLFVVRWAPWKRPSEDGTDHLLSSNDVSAN